MKRILLLLANGVEPLEMAAISEVLGWANEVGNETLEVVDVGLRSKIATTFGLSLNLSQLLKDVDLDRFDALAIPGGFEPAGFYEDALSEEFLAAIRHFANANKVIATVCVSSICLGVAGVLKGKSATTYHQIGGKRKQQLVDTGAIFLDRPIVIDGNFISSTGPGTAIEVALELLAQVTSKENADKVRGVMRIPTPSVEWYNTAQVMAQ
jgi:4-methyl-5(b-hydroxyethyl)-thiazole monophosphate biosynthesis